LSIISKKSRYAFHGLAYISKFSNGSPVPFDEVMAYLVDYSSGLTLSRGYIAKIFQGVSRAGMLEAVPGPSGGYRLARDPEQIRMIDVVEALDGPLMTNCCVLSVGGCPRQTTCGVKGFIHDCEMIFYEFLAANTVASLTERMTFPDRAAMRPDHRGRSAQGRRTLLRVRG
jgi:Rrf2 family iron-sulfur cluster assembly transcriptional regulator